MDDSEIAVARFLMNFDYATTNRDYLKRANTLILFSSPLLIAVPLFLPYFGRTIAIGTGTGLLLLPLVISIILTIQSRSNSHLGRDQPDQRKFAKTIFNLLIYLALLCISIGFGVPFRSAALLAAEKGKQLGAEQLRISKIMLMLSESASGNPRVYPDSLVDFVRRYPASSAVLMGGITMSSQSPVVSNDAITERNISQLAGVTYSGYKVPITSKREFIVLVAAVRDIGDTWIIGWSNGNVETMDSEALETARVHDAKARSLEDIPELSSQP